MNRQSATVFAASTLVAALALTGPAAAQHPGAPALAAPTKSVNMQGDDSIWRKSPYIHAFYDLTVASYAGGPARLDVDTYEKKSYAIFRDFGVSMGVGPEHMQDHLKLIPRQVVGIVKDDPKVLDNYDNFVLALFGPK